MLVDGEERDGVQPRPEEVSAVLDAAPGRQATFGSVAFCGNLVTRIGLDKDDNRNVTQRMLLVLESVAVAGEEAHRRCWERVLDGYLADTTRDRHPPRFFLNDLIRYWRTICVDFVGKERDEPEKWGLRTAKLRTARKLLFASGLLPALLSAELPRDGIRDFLAEQFGAPATDRVAWAFLHTGANDAGLRTLRAYDRWLGMLDDPESREHLAGLTALGRRPLAAVRGGPAARRRARARAAGAAVRHPAAARAHARVRDLLSARRCDSGRFLERRTEKLTRAYSFALHVLSPVVRRWGRLEVSGLEHMPLDGPVLLAGNHDSYWDPVSIGIAALPRRQIHALAKIELWSSRASGRC